MSSRTLRRRLYNWVASWSISFRRKESTSSASSTINSNFDSAESTVSVLKSSNTRLSSSNIKKVVRFAEEDGKVLTQIMNNHESNKNVVGSLDESLEDVYMRGGVIRGFITVKNLEAGRQVLVRYTEDNWLGFQQVTSKRVQRTIDSKGRQQLKEVKEKNSRLPRRRKQVDPSPDYEKTYFFKFEVDETKLNDVELVIISSLDNVIDTNHRQCYSFKCVRRSWEASSTVCSRPMNVNSSSRQL